MRLSCLACILILAVPVLGDGSSELSAKELSEAKRLYKSKCSRCHKFYNPSSYDEVEWPDWMEKMRKKSKLKDEQFDLLKRYTEALRKGLTAAEPNAKGLIQSLDAPVQEKPHAKTA